MNGLLYRISLVLTLLGPALHTFGSPSRVSADPVDSRFELAASNGEIARIALKEANRTLSTVIARLQRNSSLIPFQPQNSRWVVNRDAAKVIPALIVAAYLTDPDKLPGSLSEYLRTESSRTSRLLRLPDDVDLATGEFVYPTADPLRIQSGSTSYALGLSAVTSVVGPGPWTERLIHIVDDLFARASVQPTGTIGPIPSGDAEVNGNLLRILPSLAGWTNDPNYQDWANRIADTYIYGVLPNIGGLPVRSWDFSRDEPKDATFSLDQTSLLSGLAHLGRLEALQSVVLAGKFRPVLRNAAAAIYNESKDGGFYRQMDPDGKGGYTANQKSGLIAQPALQAGLLKFARATRETSLELRVLESVRQLPTFYDRAEGESLTSDFPEVIDLFATLSSPTTELAWLDGRSWAFSNSLTPNRVLLNVSRVLPLLRGVKPPEFG